MEENDLNGSSVEQKMDMMIHNRDRHKDAFTKWDSKIDLMLSRLIMNEDQLHEAEAFLVKSKT